MSLDAFRDLPFPDASEGRTAEVFCTGDPAIAKDTDTLEVALDYLSAAEKQIGIVKCGFFQSQSDLYRRAGVDPAIIARLSQVGSDWIGAYIAIGTAGSSKDVVYSFIKDPTDQTPKLYSISLTADENAAVHSLAGLVEKFGPPTSQATDKVQNRMGASFDHVAARWVNPASEIRFESPASQIDRMSLTYIEHRLFNYVSLMKAKAQDPDSNKM